MTRLRRIGLIVALLLVFYAVSMLLNMIVWPWLTPRLLGYEQTRAVVRTLFLLCWMVPLLQPRIRGDVRFRPVSRTWTVLLLVPFPLCNVGLGHGPPVFGSSPEAAYLAWFVAVGPIYEELIFRGYALYRAESHPRFAIVASSIAFTLMHLGTCGTLVLIAMFLFGVAAGIVRIASGGLAWPIAFHAVMNLIASILQPHYGFVGAVACMIAGAVSAGIVLCRHPKLRTGSPRL